jgi:hypothetical protein
MEALYPRRGYLGVGRRNDEILSNYVPSDELRKKN